MNARPLPTPAEIRHHREARLVGMLLVGGRLIGLAGIVLRSTPDKGPIRTADRTAFTAGPR